MITCPKCGFKNNQAQATDCPKCGLIYAKYQQAKRAEEQHISAERALHNSLRNAMDTIIEEPPSFIDLESEKDCQTYPSISFLSWFFIIFSCILGLVWVAGIKSFYSFLASSPYMQGQDRFFTTTLFAITTFVPVAISMALSGVLKLGKDIADNTRATRNYLAYLAKTKD